MYRFSRFLLIVWQCFFIAPVTRKSGNGDDGNKYTLRTWWYTLNLCVLCLCLSGGLWAVMDDLNASKVGRSLRMQNTSSSIVNVLQVALMSAVCLLAVTCSAGRHRTLMEIGQHLEHVDTVLGASTGQPVAQCAFVMVSFHAVLFVVDGCLWYSLSPISWMYCVCYVYLLIELASMLMYAQIAWCIGRRFHEINVAIERKLADIRKNYARHPRDGRPLRQRKFIRSTVFVSESNVPVNDIYCNTSIKHISIAKLQELHWSLCNCIKMVNDKFGWQLFLQLMCKCVQLIVTPYFMIMDLFYPVLYGSTDIKFILTQVVWVLTHLSYLLLIVLPTSYATKKAEKTAVVISKYLTIDVEPIDMKQLEIFVLQLQKYAIDFSACGIINLHRSTITTVIGTAITYLVILIQFQNS